MERIKKENRPAFLPHSNGNSQEKNVNDIELFAPTVNNLMGLSINEFQKRVFLLAQFYFCSYYFNLRHVFDVARPFVQSRFHC